MGIKKEKPTILGLFLITTFLFITFSFAIDRSPETPETKVCVDPTEETVYPGDTFAINVNVIDVVNLWTYNFIVFYETIPIDGVSVELPEGHFMKPINRPENLIIIHQEIDDNYNATHGRIRVSVTLRSVYVACLLRHMKSEPARAGSGTLFTITFNCTGEGASVLNLYETHLIKFGGSSIPHIRIHGLINAHRYPSIDDET